MKKDGNNSPSETSSPEKSKTNRSKKSYRSEGKSEAQYSEDADKVSQIKPTNTRLKKSMNSTLNNRRSQMSSNQQQTSDDASLNSRQSSSISRPEAVARFNQKKDYNIKDLTYTEKLNAKRNANQEISPITSNNVKSKGLNLTEDSNITKPQIAINIYDLNQQRRFNRQPDLDKSMESRSNSKFQDYNYDPNNQIYELMEELQKAKEESSQIIEFNRELQWTLMVLKEDNDKMKDYINQILNGEDPKLLEKKMVDDLFNVASPNNNPEQNFKTPHIDNVFDIYSEFQPASAAVKSLKLDQNDENIKLRQSAFAQEFYLLKDPSQEEIIEMKTPVKMKKMPEQSAIKEIIQETKKKMGIASSKSYKNSNNPISPSVEKYDQINSKAIDMDVGTRTKYVPSNPKESFSISLIKDRVLKGSIAQQTPQKSIKKQKTQQAPVDIITKARRSILHESDDDVYTPPKRQVTQKAVEIDIQNKNYQKKEWDYLDQVQSAIEKRASKNYAQNHGKEYDDVKDIIYDVSRQSIRNKQNVQNHIERLREFARNSNAFEIYQPKKMKDAIIEKYFDKTIKLGLYREDNTDLNMSPEGKIRRSKLYESEAKINDRNQFIENSYNGKVQAPGPAENL